MLHESSRHSRAERTPESKQKLPDAHDLVVSLSKAYETYYYQRKLSMVIELCDGGDLYARNPYTEVQAALITKQILSAINYMHKRNVIHRDCK